MCGYEAYFCAESGGIKSNQQAFEGLNTSKIKTGTLSPDTDIPKTIADRS
jgi:hypothetical protein